MNIAVLGANGMLGSEMVRTLEWSYGVQSFPGRIHQPSDIPDLGNFDVVINCVGRVPQKKAPASDIIWANSVLPHLFAERSRFLISFSTDCVFSGKGRGSKDLYSYEADRDTDSQYGISKVAGEVISHNTLVIRCSFIGHGNPNHLLEWFLNNTDPIVPGYLDHMWNGFTTLELATIIRDNLASLVESGCSGALPPLVQLGNQIISKAGLLEAIRDVYGVSTEVKTQDTEDRINRCLKDYSQEYHIKRVVKPHVQMLSELREYAMASGLWLDKSNRG